VFATYCFATYQGIGCLILCVVLLSPSVSHSQTIIKDLAPAEFNSHAQGSWTDNWQQTDNNATSVSAEGTAQPLRRVHELSVPHCAWPYPCSMKYLHLCSKPANAHFTFSEPCTVIHIHEKDQQGALFSNLFIPLKLCSTCCEQTIGYRVGGLTLHRWLSC